MRWFQRPAEFLCKCGRGHGPGSEVPGDIADDLANRLDALRTALGVPVVVTSGLRCYPHNVEVGGAMDSAHLTGQACDLACVDAGFRRAIVVAGLELFSYLELGPHHVHVDTKPREAPPLLALGAG